MTLWICIWSARKMLASCWRSCIGWLIYEQQPEQRGVVCADAVPKTILQLMNVEGMTRENVASHLQVTH